MFCMKGDLFCMKGVGLESMRKMSNRTDSEIIPIPIPIPILSVVLVSQRKIMM